MVGYGPFFLYVIHKEGLCPSSGDINRLMMMMIGRKYFFFANRSYFMQISENFALIEDYLPAMTEIVKILSHT
jgi:hypothetical protein